MVNMIESQVNESDYTAMDIAAAFLKMALFAGSILMLLPLILELLIALSTSFPYSLGTSTKVYLSYMSNIMAISYDRLWKLLVDRKMNRTELKEASGISFNVLPDGADTEHVLPCQVLFHNLISDFFKIGLECV